MNVRSKDGAYGHNVDIEYSVNYECDICHKIKDVLNIDTSEGEYASLSICNDCVNNLYKLLKENKGVGK
jgi:uncharacterized protein YuzB (UPF0349 family)